MFFPENIFAEAIMSLPLSVRTRNVLVNANVRTVRDLVGLTNIDLLRIKHYGPKSHREVCSFMEANGLQFGMEIPMSPLMKSIGIVTVVGGMLAIRQQELYRRLQARTRSFQDLDLENILKNLRGPDGAK